MGAEFWVSSFIDHKEYVLHVCTLAIHDNTSVVDHGKETMEEESWRSISVVDTEADKSVRKRSWSQSTIADELGGFPGLVFIVSSIKSSSFNCKSLRHLEP